ncbi:hypothetical protein PIB30_068810 [Stylosanthes scabra]|uniref:Uncharacterized protein n=1 Tax=Stylosanthes scabra TaxID=79078 RepID=A0ABU6ZLM3_9FABA|nr:hypothetical protein [Stylosanthes scabra]
MAGKEVTLERLRRLIRPGSSQSVPAVPVPAPGPSRAPVERQPVPADDNVALPEGGGDSSNIGGVERSVHERPADDATADPKRLRVSEGTNREFCSMDRSFDASGFIASNLLGPRAQDVLKDYDPMESIRWADGRVGVVKLNGDLKALNLQRIEAEKEKLAAEQAKVQAEGDLKSLSGKLEVLEKEKVEEAERWKNRESELEGEIQGLRESISDEKARADKAEALLAELEKSQDEVVRMAEDSVMATERALKDQISLLLLTFDVSQLGAFKAIVDGKIVDLPE